MYDSDLDTEPCGEQHDDSTCVRPAGHEGYHMGRKSTTVMSWNDHGHSFLTSTAR